MEQKIETITPDGFFEITFKKKLLLGLALMIYCAAIVHLCFWVLPLDPTGAIQYFIQWPVIGYFTLLLFAYMTLPFIAFFTGDQLNIETCRPRLFWKSAFYGDYTQVIRNHIGCFQEHVRNTEKQKEKLAAYSEKFNNADLKWYPPQPIKIRHSLDNKVHHLIYVATACFIASKIGDTLPAPYSGSGTEFLILFATLAWVIPFIEIVLAGDPCQIEKKQPLIFWRAIFFRDLERHINQLMRENLRNKANVKLLQKQLEQLEAAHAIKENCHE
jgi:hypothetical protein